MKLFFYKPKQFNPIILLIVKISNNDELQKIEAMAHEFFLILMEQNVATEENILIISVIKDHEKATINLIIPSTKSNDNLVNRCHNTNFVNALVIETLKKSDTDFYIELGQTKIFIHTTHLNLMGLSKFYKLYNS